MPAVPTEANPIRDTLLAILRQLNQADATHGGTLEDPALELKELETRLREFGPVLDGSVKVALAVGLLLRNGMIETRADPGYSWQRGRDVAQRYQITSEGKRFLVDAIQTSERIS